MDFVFVSLAGLAIVVVLLVLLARAYPGGGEDVIDWKPTRSPEVEAELEAHDVEQMVEAQNAYRRRRGQEPLSEAELGRRVAEDQRARERASRSQDGLREEVARTDRDELDVDAAIRAERERRSRDSRI